MGLNHHKIGYYLTPKGFAEKAQLTLHLISWTVQHYSALKDVIGKRLLEMENEGIRRIVFYGVSDEMEIALITLQGTNLKLVGIIEDDEKYVSRIIFGYELEPMSQVKGLRPDAVLVTSVVGQEERKERLRKCLDSERVQIWTIPSL